MFNITQSVYDNISGNEQMDDFRDVRQGTDYTYYPDGSLKSDANKGITLITYDTFLKKVKQVDFASGAWVKWFYDGSGTLYKRTNSAGDVWEYLPSGLIYKNGSPYSVNIPDGRAIYSPSGAGSGAWVYEFEYRDHQQNLHVAFKADGNQLVVSQVQETDPWGMILKPLSTLASSNPQKFDFVNRERDDDFGLNIMHLGARMYDPVVPRFWQVEPKPIGQENWSVYQYGYNNPVLNADPNGDCPICFIIMGIGLLTASQPAMAPSGGKNAKAEQQAYKESYNNYSGQVAISLAPPSVRAVLTLSTYAKETEAKGGAYKDLKVEKGKEERHHMPSSQALQTSESGVSHGEGPSVVMPKAEHQKTASWGRSKEAAEFRKKEAELIKEGKFQEAQKMGVDNVRALFGRKYDKQIRQMEEYTQKMLNEKQNK